MNFPHPRKKKHNIMTKRDPKNTSKDTFKDNRIFFLFVTKKCALLSSLREGAFLSQTENGFPAVTLTSGPSS